jgi:hypothetical protein
MKMRLCYVEPIYSVAVLWFTSAPLDKQWGDDWNDAPYEHNAGNPYKWDGDGKEYHLLRLIVETELSDPCHNFCNSPYSVEDINNKIRPWLYDEYGEMNGMEIWAGEDLETVKRKIWESGGTVYVRESPYIEGEL